MISPEQIKEKASRIYTTFLAASVKGENIFPLSIRSNKKPSTREVNTLMKELVPLLNGSKEKIGFGYKVTLKNTSSTKMGKQDLPEEIIFESESDYLKYLRKETEFKRFQEDSNLLLTKIPALKHWVVKYPGKIILNNGKWQDILKVVEYFQSNPTPNLYIRELPPKVHTKFIESNKTIIEELLFEIIPDKININGKTFEERLHLKYYEPYFHIRILDTQISRNHFSGLTDIGVTPKELYNLNIPVSRIFILENKQNYKNVENFLSLPMMTGAVAIFGSGFRVAKLGKIPWFSNKQIFYWGDIDIQGFEILASLRSHLQNVVSFLMDEETFKEFHEETVNGVESKTELKDNLKEDEMIFYRKLKTLNEKNRLEQEKIPQEYVIKKLTKTLE